MPSTLHVGLHTITATAHVAVGDDLAQLGEFQERVELAGMQDAAVTMDDETISFTAQVAKTDRDDAETAARWALMGVLFDVYGLVPDTDLITIT